MYHAHVLKTIIKIESENPVDNNTIITLNLSLPKGSVCKVVWGKEVVLLLHELGFSLPHEADYQVQLVVHKSPNNIAVLCL